MKIYYCNQGQWTANTSKRNRELSNRLPNIAGERYRLLVEYTHLGGEYFLAAKDDAGNAVVVEQLSEAEARSLTIAYLRERKNLFTAAAESVDRLEKLAASHPVEKDNGNFFTKGKYCHRADEGVEKVIAELREHTLRSNPGLRIILSDHFGGQWEQESPDICLWNDVPEALLRPKAAESDIERIKKVLVDKVKVCKEWCNNHPVEAVCIGVILVGVLGLLLHGCGSDEPQKKTEPIGQPRAVQREIPAVETAPAAQPSGVGEAPPATNGDGVPAARPEQPAGEQPKENDNGQTEVSMGPGQTH